MKTILTFSLAAAATMFVLGSTASAGPGGREPDPRIAPREFPVMHTYGPAVSARSGTTIGLSVMTDADHRELRLEQRFNAKGQPFYLYVPVWMEPVR